MSLQTLQKLIDRVDEYQTKPDKNKLPKLRQDVTRLLKDFEGDEEVTDILLGIRDVIGIGEETKVRQTAAEIVQEYEKAYAGMKERQRTAFKAKITKRKEEAQEAGELEDVATFTALAERMTKESEQIRRKFALDAGSKYVKK